MTNSDILKMVIKKAMDKGFPNPRPDDCGEDWYDKMVKKNYYYIIIFDKTFAKYFFNSSFKNWKIYIQKMVLSEEPLKYLKTFL